jgi:single-stranded-DNA-specific exonuclease
MVYHIKVFKRQERAGATLLIAVDCGITSVEPVKYANSLGIDTIICDHHEPAEALPDAFAILDPLKPDCTYPVQAFIGLWRGLQIGARYMYCTS